LLSSLKNELNWLKYSPVHQKSGQEIPQWIIYLCTADCLWRNKKKGKFIPAKWTTRIPLYFHHSRGSIINVLFIFIWINSRQRVRLDQLFFFFLPFSHFVLHSLIGLNREDEGPKICKFYSTIDIGNIIKKAKNTHRHSYN
jgi:hypothetical protein